ncbi:hypothetical protein AVDCRST_MAG92-2475 [uncultured Coleofasciculus sp.]|uniref:Uncharacterized protein n=1 Tax=uncultured Coleofasciculus sp. TaxID=1267456 RepID=A0A6J4IXT0_9CYAN|nr:hypothetical protein AVDCRST_MAG92-2475 [uncultured Coleofasciculus sp.]
MINRLVILNNLGSVTTKNSTQLIKKHSIKVIKAQ